MTLAEAKERIEKIRAEATKLGAYGTVGDPESAHYEEDEFRRDVLRYLAEVAPAELGELARLALTTEDIYFPRWYA